MGFSAKQVQALRRNLDRRHIRTREANGRELSYIEGWYALSEANRIFGFDGWSRQTIESKCVLARENRGTFLADLYRPGADHGARRRRNDHSRRSRHRVKAVVPRQVRCTTLRSRPRKPTPPNERWPLSENRSGLSSIARKRTHRCNAQRFSSRRPPVRQPSRVLVSILTIRPRSRGHRTTMGDDTRVR